LTARKAPAASFAICIDSSEYTASLEMHKIYHVLQNKQAEHDSDLRIIDESGEDYLYPASYFVMVDLPRQTVRALNKAYAHSFQHAG